MDNLFNEKIDILISNLDECLFKENDIFILFFDQSIPLLKSTDEKINYIIEQFNKKETYLKKTLSTIFKIKFLKKIKNKQYFFDKNNIEKNDVFNELVNFCNNDYYNLQVGKLITSENLNVSAYLILIGNKEYLNLVKFLEWENKNYLSKNINQKKSIGLNF